MSPKLPIFPIVYWWQIVTVHTELCFKAAGKWPTACTKRLHTPLPSPCSAPIEDLQLVVNVMLSCSCSAAVIVAEHFMTPGNLAEIVGTTWLKKITSSSVEMQKTPCPRSLGGAEIKQGVSTVIIIRLIWIFHWVTSQPSFRGYEKHESHFVFMSPT